MIKGQINNEKLISIIISVNSVQIDTYNTDKIKDITIQKLTTLPVNINIPIWQLKNVTNNNYLFKMKEDIQYLNEE